MQTLDEFAKANDLARTSVVIEEWTGKCGLALVARATGAQVTPAFANPAALEAWFEREGGRIAGFVSRGWDVPPSPFLAKVEAAFGRDRRGFAKAVHEAEQALDYTRSTVDAFSKDDRPDANLRRILADRRARIPLEEAALADRRADLAAFEARAERLRTDPASLFLPIGALVRVKEEAGSRRTGPNHAHGDMLPRAGTQGVVVGLTDAGRGWTVKVAFGRTFRDRGTDEWSPEPESPIKMSFDAEDLEFVALGAFHDGTPCRSVAFAETHRQPEDLGKADPGTLEMVVVQDGLAWRIWEFKGSEPGKDWYDAQGWDGVDDLDFLVPIGTEPSSPAP
jgi:hypothetical protein